MRIPDIAVNRKVTVLMMTVAILLFGLLALSKLGLELLPDMDFPIVSIITGYHGASPEDIEEAITRPIEQSIATVKGINNITSQSLENYSVIMVEFDWGANLDFAAQDLRDMIDQVAGYLPREVTRPIVFKFDLSQMPVLSYAITGSMESYHLRKTLDDEISMRLSQLSGVASVTIMGGEERELQIIVDKHKLDSHNISISEVQMMLAASNINMPAGHIISRKDEFLLRTVAQFSSLEDIRNTPLKLTQTGQPIYISDVAEVRDGRKEKRYLLRADMQPTIYMMVSKESGANTLTVTRRIKEEVERIHEDYGDQVVFHEVMDMGFPIYRVTSGAASNLIVGGLLAIFIMFLFLRNWRPTIAISIAIPVSVVATFVSMYLADFSLNLMTIGGLALGVGMLVDNAIVVIENIYRHLEMGKDKISAAKDGASEVGMAITASTLTTVAVFLPMVFSEGMTGILVRGLALTVAFSLFCSLFVALTLVPVIASQLFKYDDKLSPVEKSKLLFEKLKTRYLRLLDWTLHHKTATLITVAVAFFASLALLGVIGTDFMPAGEMPFIILNVKMPAGTTLDETDLFVAQAEEIFNDTPGVSNVMAIIGPMDEAVMDPTNPQDVSEAQVIGTLVELKDRQMSAEQIRESIRSRLPDVVGANIQFLGTADMMGSGADPIEIKIFGRDLNTLRRIASNIEQKVAAVPDVVDITNSVREAKSEAHIIIDKQKALHYGLTTGQIANAINTATVGSLAGIYRAGGEEIDIRVRLAEEFRQTEEQILNINISSPLGVSIPLNQIASVEYTEGPDKITRENQVRFVRVGANIKGTRDIGGKIREVQNQIEGIVDNLPSGYYVSFGGTFEDMQEAFQTLALALILAIVLVYLVMASQFESLKQPFIVMFTIPLASIGVMLALFLSGTTLSVASFVGGIILTGIVVNNGIVLVDHTNQLRRAGVEKHEALMKSGSDRMRPVLITALTTIMGMLPMALSTGEGSETKVPMALTVIGGLISATFFTLIIIPVIYSVVEKIKYKD